MDSLMTKRVLHLKHLKIYTWLLFHMRHQFLREIAPTPTKEERRDPMVWLSKHLSDLLKEERKDGESTSKKRTYEDDPYGWMSDVFSGIFKWEKKKMEVHKDGTFKINPDESKKESTRARSQDREKLKVSYNWRKNLFPTILKKKKKRRKWLEYPCSI